MVNEDDDSDENEEDNLKEELVADNIYIH